MMWRYVLSFWSRAGIFAFFVLFGSLWDFFLVFCGIIWIYSCFGVFNLWICNLKKIANQILDSRHQRVPQTRFHTWIMLHRSTLYAPDDSKLHIGIHPLYKVIHSKYLHTYYEKSGKIKKRTQLKVWKLRNDG